jgi:hypothetical protein
MNNIVFDLILLEADRILAHKQKDLDLYYKNTSGEIVPLGEAYSDSVNNLMQDVFRRKKMRYHIAFTETIDELDKIKPISNKLLRFFIREMNYGNVLKSYSIRDIQQVTGISNRYMLSSMKEIIEKDFIRFEVERNRRTYMVNPIYFYKGSLKKIFYSVQKYNNMPKQIDLK